MGMEKREMNQEEMDVRECANNILETEPIIPDCPFKIRWLYLDSKGKVKFMDLSPWAIKTEEIQTNKAEAYKRALNAVTKCLEKLSP